MTLPLLVVSKAKPTPCIIQAKYRNMENKVQVVKNSTFDRCNSLLNETIIVT